ncbi:heterokaryon incompatibility protein-domain-containing protein [Lasiosphaeria miniovina]|uniref:Heterokaryon incompatibility protein-domain-containing protein n=1 Tax=Lasiosphaeria miniovina TaxID=1954250 RepID=A0AA39ZTK3_9PEZI|nr:heterokaryon incompatibility protein-domain-containing protein [Lasiosphaeria miniovina]KAK0703454.1 heterokaryon incompatibility protein-domain-containing protein [Lasiosphaeria miniovina]
MGEKQQQTLCKFCAGLDLRDAIKRLALPDGTHSSPWHKKLSAIHIASASCVLCAAIMKGWAQSRKQVVEENERDGMFDAEDPPRDLHNPLIEIGAYLNVSVVTLEVIRRRRIVVDGVFLKATCRPKSRASYEAHDPVEAELRVFKESGDGEGPAVDRNSVASEVWQQNSNTTAMGAESALVADELMSPNPLSQKSLGIARSWISKCLKNHGSACGPVYPDEEPSWRHMPTRVLEIVPGSAMVYLRVPSVTQPADSRYVALSHCWGRDGTPFTTTHKNLQGRMEGIQISELPRTFRDAVVLVASLGLRYVWIDSLCIIQDDMRDWETQAAEMANIYRKAYLVIGAANGPSDTIGFLEPRKVQDLVRWEQSSAEPSGICLQLLPAKGRRWTDRAGPDPLSLEPTNARAWCLQERELPMRALSYGSQQAFWECERMRASEDGHVVTQQGSHLMQLCLTGNIGDSVFARPQRGTGSESDQVNWVDWYRMIERYSTRQITKDTDRLPALSGLAQAVTRKIGGEYMAGLWKSGLLEGLMWYRAQPGSVLAVTPEYVAPSWSWASVAGSIKFPMYSWYSKRARWKAEMSDFESLAQYISHMTEQKDLDPYGQLRGGHLTVKVPLLAVTSLRPCQANAPLISNLFGQEPSRPDAIDTAIEVEAGEEGATKKVWIEGGFDRPADGDIKVYGQVSVILLTRLPYVLEDGFLEHCFGLIVVKEADGRYRRVGFVDGFLLELTGDPEAPDELGIIGYPHASEPQVDKRPNSLAYDPLSLGKVEVTLC